MTTDNRFQICLCLMGALIGGTLLNHNPVLCAEAGLSSLVREYTDTTTGSGPSIVFEKTQIDLGKVTSGKDIVTEFAFRNMGSETLTIEKITSG